MRPSPAGLRLLRPWEAPASRFDDHHVELARMLRDHIDALGIQIDRLTSRIQELIGAIPAAQPPGDGAGPSGPGTAAATTGTQDTDQPLPPTPTRPAVGAAPPGRGPRHRRQGRPGAHRRTWAGHGPVPHPRAAGVVGQAGTQDHPVRRQRRAGTTGKGNPYLKGVLGEVAAAAAKTDTFPWASATAAWSGASASSRPWSPSPAPSW